MWLQIILLTFYSFIKTSIIGGLERINSESSSLFRRANKWNHFEPRDSCKLFYVFHRHRTIVNNGRCCSEKLIDLTGYYHILFVAAKKREQSLTPVRQLDRAPVFLDRWWYSESGTSNRGGWLIDLDGLQSWTHNRWAVLQEYSYYDIRFSYLLQSQENTTVLLYPLLIHI
jgi:hypothetical protein